MPETKELNVEDMKAMLRGNAAPKTPIASVVGTNNKDGKVIINVTDDIVDVFFPPVLAKVVEDVKPKLTQVITEGLAAEAKSLQSDVDKHIKKANTDITKSIADSKNEFLKLQDQIIETAKQVRPIEVRTESNTVQMTGVQHSKFELLLHVVAAGLPVFMVGPAGTGKTAGAEHVAKGLGLDFYAMSVGSQTSKSDIFGYMDAVGNYHETAFYKAYVNGGVFLLDEADAGNANVLVGLNAALSNGYVFFPNGVMSKMHEDFRMIATANTYGNGASRQYVGRNQLDAATLDRFTVITWDIDARIEEAIATISPTYGSRWLAVVRAVRHEAIDQLELRAVVSPRATLRGATLLERGVEFEQVVQVALIANMPEAEREVLLNLATATWAKHGTVKKAKAGGTATVVDKPDLDKLVSVFDGAEELAE